MKWFAAIVAVLLAAAAGAALWLWEPWSDEAGDQVDYSTLSAEFQGSACREIAGLAAGLSEHTDNPLLFLRDFGKQVAGIRRPPRAYGDLARGGRNVVPGKGFLARFDDGTTGQARHFAGVAVATTFGGASPTRLLSIFVRDDAADSPDGLLSDEAIEFSTEVLGGELGLDETPGWLLDHLCRRKPG